jgi:outer membrane lipoprotein
MNRGRELKLFTLLGLLVWTTGCAHVISADLRTKARQDLSFATVLANPEAYQGTTVIWGGRIIDTLNEENKTLIKVLQMPLDFTDMPEDEEVSQGRFIAAIDGYVDPEIYRKGRMITIAGKINGRRSEPLGEIAYTYPLVDAQETYLWKSYYGPYAPYPFPYWYWYGYSYPFAWPYYGPPFLF